MRYWVALLAFGGAISVQGQTVVKKPVEQSLPSKSGTKINTATIGIRNPVAIPRQPMINRSSGDQIRFTSTQDGKAVSINIEKGPPVSSEVQPEWWSAQWIVEMGDGVMRLRSRWTGCYLHVEHGKLECGDAPQSWHSSYWRVEQSEKWSGYYRIRNKWNGCFVNDDDGALKCGNLYSADPPVGHWLVELVGTAPEKRDRPDLVSPNQAEIDRINAKGCPVEIWSSDNAVTADKKCLKIQDYAAIPEDWNDDIEAIRIYDHNVVVELFEHGNFQGRKVTAFCHGTELIGDPENEVSSIRVKFQTNIPTTCRGGIGKEERNEWDF